MTDFRLVFMDSFRSSQELDESLDIEELLAVSEKVKDVEFSSERAIER